MKVGSLFAGIGGFDLAARWMGWETRWFSEIDPYASAVLAKHWPGVVNHGDITKIDFTTVEPVDLLCGGFPCQDISEAGKRLGIHGERSGLWAEFARAIRELRPRWVVIENVSALLGRGFDVVRGDLRAAGYRVGRPVLMSASQFGAPQERERVWIVANANHTRLERAIGQGQPHPSWETGTPARREPLRPDGGHWPPGPRQVSLIPRDADGVSARAHRLRGLGNAIVPQCAYVIFQAIQEAEERMRAA